MNKLFKRKSRMKSLPFFGLLLVLAAWSYSGCTSVPIAYTEPAHLNMSGVSRIAIYSGHIPLTGDMIWGYLNNAQVISELSRRLTATGKYTVASAEELKAWQEWSDLATYQAPAIEIGSEDLVAAYMANAARADSSYNKNIIKTSGVVKEIGRSSKGNYFARLGVGNDAIDVYFDSSQLNKLMAVDKGNTITVVGQCVGFNPPNMEDTAEILRILGAGRSVNLIQAIFPVGDYPGSVDAVISTQSAVWVSDGYEPSGVLVRTVMTDIHYSVVRARDNSVIGEGKKSGSHRYSQPDQTDVSEVASRIAPYDKLIAEMLPAQHTISVNLAKEKGNKEAKKAMGDAEKLVKAKDYAAAATAYANIYAQYKNFAAGYNYAVLTEATKGSAAAIELMEALANQTDESLAWTTLAEMQKRNEGTYKSRDLDLASLFISR